jgi:hypothetical protein
MTTSRDITGTVIYPVYATKAAFQADIETLRAQKFLNLMALEHFQYRMDNTDTDNWTAASTSRHDA